MNAGRDIGVVAIAPKRQLSSVRAGQGLAAGTRVDCFELQEVLGSGSFGITYKAYDHELERPVAIKEYFPRGLAMRSADGKGVEPSAEGESEDFGFGLRRFINEARALAQFTEPNIVRVLRYLEANGTGYLVMNLEDGRSLGQVVRQLNRLSEKQVRALAIHLLRGLDAVHRKDFLHRDIKPANILVRSSGPPILLDFGAARLALEQQRTGALTVTLTPGYAPIEQYGRYEEQGPWTDLYGLGATLYHCLLRVSPANATDRLVAMRDDEPDPVSLALDSLADTYSADLVGIIEWMLKPRAADRPRRARDVLDVLRLNVSPSSGRAPVAKPAARPGPPVAYAAPPTRTAPVSNNDTYLGTDTYPEAPLRPVVQTRSPALIQPHPAAPPHSTAPPHPTTPPQPTAPPVTARAVVLTPDVLAHAKRELSDFVGPIASVLVTNAAKQCANESEFFDLLAEELDSSTERKTFYENCSKLSRSAIRLSAAPL